MYIYVFDSFRRAKHCPFSECTQAAHSRRQEADHKGQADHKEQVDHKEQADHVGRATLGTDAATGHLGLS